MKINFVLQHPNLSGGVRVLATLAERLAARGHDVCAVAAPRPDHPLRSKVKSLLTGHGWPTRTKVSSSHFDGLPIDFRCLDAARDITDSDLPDADVVVATWWRTAEWVANLSERKGAKVYFLQHHETVFGGQDEARVVATWRLPMRKVVVAQWLADLARDRYGDPDAVVIPLGIDRSLFHAPPRTKATVPTVGVMYSSAAFKGCDVSFRAYERARREVPGLRLITFGAARPEQAGLPLAKGDVTFTFAPAQRTIREQYAACDAWLFASRCEGFGLPLIEAMACRTPVIATPTGVGPEVVAAGAGVGVPIDDAEALAAEIVRFARMGDPEWRWFSDAAYAASLQYDWDRSVDAFEAALADAAGLRDRAATHPSDTTPALQTSAR